MSVRIKPMLSCKCPPDMTFEEYLACLRFPLWCTPKIDGIRCLVSRRHGEKAAVTRSLKPIPNHYVRERVTNECPLYIDGELTCGDNFQAVTSGIMTHGGQPDFTFYVFGCRIHENWITYREVVGTLEDEAKSYPSFCKILFPTICDNLDQLLEYEDWCLGQGAEGVMARPPSSTYKYGRATLNSQELIAIKRFHDAEGVIVDFEELMVNKNPQVTNALGLAERSSEQDGLVPGNTLGAFWVETKEGLRFKIGTGVGLTAKLRKRIWLNRDFYKGKLVTFKSQLHGVKDKPRIPVFKGFREDL